MKFWILAPSVTVLVLSASVNAATITHNEYSLDTDTNIVTGGGLEWLQWDETAGSSIVSALGTYEADGWRLATNYEMASLFNSFDFDLTFDTDENTHQLQRTPWSAAIESEYTRFIDLFGDTYAVSTLSCPTCLPSDTYVSAIAYFGTDNEFNDLFNLAGVSDDFVAGTTQREAEAVMTGENYYDTDSSSSHGVALVRTSVVPVPAAVWLFGSGLIGFVGLARRKKS